MNRGTSGRTFFYILLLFIVLVSYMMLRPYLGTVVFSWVVVTIFKPVYDFFLARLRGHVPGAIALTIVTIFLIMLIPLWMMIDLTIDQVYAFGRDIQAIVTDGDRDFLETINTSINDMVEKAPPWIANYVENSLPAETGVEQTLERFVRPVASFMTTSALSLGNVSIDWLTRLVVFLAMLGAIFPNHARLIQLLKDLSPLDDEIDQFGTRRKLPHFQCEEIGGFLGRLEPSKEDDT